MIKTNYWKITWAILVVCATTAIASPAQTFTTLATFDGTNGVNPFSPLVQGLDGNLYGTTLGGGANCSSEGGCGTIFKITPAGELTTIYNFCSQGSYPNCADGFNPAAGLVLATNGNLYGTTTQGGSNCSSYSLTGCGTVYEITPPGKLATLYSFCSKPNCGDGSEPNGLVQATDGTFYGTTYAGGASDYGTVFKITPVGKLTTLYSFCSEPPCANGQFPEAGLVQGLNGNFYGTTGYGGAYCRGGCGTVFEMTPAGKLTTLYSFCLHAKCADGAVPFAALTLATSGNFYGTTTYGGDCVYSEGCGTVLAITPAGKLATVYRFCLQTGCPDGFHPNGMVQATNGNFFGTTNGGGIGCIDCGTVFQITTTGTLTTLYSFCSQPGCTDGDSPTAGLVQATNGNFYGTTPLGGNSACNTPEGCGTVFSLSTGLGPFVETLPGAGKVGAKVGILGNNLGGATSVTFNGNAATFNVKSSTLISTYIPLGATTGYVTVTTPSGTLTSNVSFHVIQ